jgi:hypothetical protein
MAEFTNYAQMLELLAGEVKRKSSGTLFIRSNCNHAITFGLEKGRINYIFFGPRKGIKAINKIREIDGGSYRFEPTNVGSLLHSLPSTEEILAQLNLTREAPRHPPQSINSSSVSAADRAMICYQLKGILVEYLGPIAEIVLNDAMCETEQFCSSPEHTQIFIDRLAQDIEDPVENVQFKTKANHAIEKVLKT